MVDRVAPVAVQKARRANRALGGCQRRSRHDDTARHRRIAAETRRKTQRALAEASAEVRQALDEAGEEVRQALDEAAARFIRRLMKFGSRFSFRRRPITCVTTRSARLSAQAKEEAEGLPVPIVPGTRVTEARATPPTPRGLGTDAAPAVSTRSSAASTVTGRLSATRERAVADARRMMQEQRGRLA